ncbi:MAG: hypothetical protein ACT4PT_01780 [Methanobacteriota archaeon]
MLVIVIAVPLAVAAARHCRNVEVWALGASASLAFAAIDVAFFARGDIGAVYLADAIVEVVLLLGWLFAARRGL